MPTDLQKMYDAAREGDPVEAGDGPMAKALGAAGARRPRGHHAALRHLARTTGLDKDTIDRCLKRARTADIVEAKRARKERS